MIQKLFQWGFYGTFCVFFASGPLSTHVDAQQFENEEVLFFDGGAAQTGTANGGTVVFPLQSQQWRFWFQHVRGSRVSPDGRQVAYLIGDNLNVTDLAGQNPRVVVSGTKEVYVATWSPNGDRLAYYEQDENDFNQYHLRVIDLQGNQLQSQPTNARGGPPTWTLGTPPAWSPNGLEIAFVDLAPVVLAGQYNAWTLYTLNVVSGSVEQLFDVPATNGDSSFDDPVEYLGMPSWSPKGDQIAVILHRRNGTTVRNDVALIPADGGSATIVTSHADTTSAAELPQLFATAWSPDGSQIAYSLVTNSGLGEKFGIYTIPVNGSSQWKTGFIPAIPGVGFRSSNLQWTILNPGPKLGISVLPNKPNYDVDEDLEVQITVTHRGDGSATYTFEGGLFSQDPGAEDGETPVVTFGEFETPEPFLLSDQEPERTFTIPAVATKPGVLNLLSSIIGQPAEGKPFTLDAEKAIIVSPLSTAITITNKRHHWNSTKEAEWGARAKAINQLRRTDEQEPYLNLIEIELLIKNESDEPIENLNLPDARDILSYFQSTSEDPAVPLLPIRLYGPVGEEVDLTNPEDPTEVNDVSLQPGETATFAWVVEAYEIDVDVREDPFDLEFTPLILGSQSGVNLQTSARETFSIRLRGPIVVNVTSDDRDFDPEDGVIDVDPDEEGEQISLRAAIEYANETPGLDRIEFDIPGNGVPTIEVGDPPDGTSIMLEQPDGDLFPHSTRYPTGEPAVITWLDGPIYSALVTTDPVEIDGTTQAGGWVELVGSPTFKFALNGLEIRGGDSLVRGLVINRFWGIGLVLREKGHNQIAGNRLGTDTTGMAPLGNGAIFRLEISHRILKNAGSHEFSIRGDRDYSAGLLVNSPNNVIGGNTEADRNLFAGHWKENNGGQNRYNTPFALPFSTDLLVSGTAASGNAIIGNYIGTDAAGDQIAEMESIVVHEQREFAAGILINNGASRNEVRDNVAYSILMEDAYGTTVTGNTVGLKNKPSDSISRGGIWAYYSANDTITDNTVHGNVSILRSEIIDLKDNIIGGKMSLNIGNSENVRIRGNMIGFDAEGSHNEETYYSTVSANDSTDITLGGSNPGEGNTIAMTAGFDGYPLHGAIQIWPDSSNDTGGIRLVHVGNNFVAHPTVAPSKEAYVADLNNDGPDPIEFGDLDGKQNYPRVTKATLEGNKIRFEGNLDSSFGGANYHLDFYSVQKPLPSGHGGSSMGYVGRGIVTTGIDGYGQFFDILLPVGSNPASRYTATATRIDGGETSEFSRNIFLERGASSDSDGVSDEQEVELGDRNGDGIQDSEQDNVASFSAANGADTTIEVSAASSQSSDPSPALARSDFSTLDDANPTLLNVLSETQASMGAPSKYVYTNGVLTFEVPDLSVGASVSIRIILADDATPETLWVSQADGTWTNTLPATITGNEIVQTLTDGGAGDRDGEANGRIVAALGAATALPPIPDMVFTIERHTNSHTLSWPLPYSNALLEFSPDLSPDSWDILNLPLNFEGDQWQLTLPNPLPEINDSGFYRLRYQK